MTTDTAIRQVFLQPGDWHFGDRATRISTLLGSCVSITLWHPRLLVGGMCHYMLPRGDGRRDRALDGRYADEALQLLLMAAQRAGAKPEELQVKLFGGGDMFEASGATIHVSAQNVSAARDLARRHGLRVVSEDLGGIGHRHLRYEVGSGAVWVKHARRTLSMGGA